MEPLIQVQNLQKSFVVRETGQGFLGNIRQLIQPRRKELIALHSVSMSIARGERVAFIGPNGAGKSTTIKILSGILMPSAGQVTVAGLVPWQDRQKLSHRIGTVFGQRSQLWYHLPARDTFRLLGKMYGVDAQEHARRLVKLIDRFDIKKFLDKPVRTLSLGERMRCELVGSLLHQPEILFLDEPTIGLDVSAKAIIRELIRDASRDHGVTVLLTSHDTGDIENVCERVIILHAGRILADRSRQELQKHVLRRKRIRVLTQADQVTFEYPNALVSAPEPHILVIDIDGSQVSVQQVVTALMAATAVQDITISDPPLDEVISSIYGSARP
jgi:ABC-2 type transport system ATP-binding protein